MFETFASVFTIAKETWNLQLVYHVIGPPEEEVPGLPDSSLLAGENAGHPALECSPFRCDSESLGFCGHSD